MYVATLLTLLSIIGIIFYIIQYCIIRRPIPKCRLVELNRAVPLTKAESTEEAVEAKSERWCIIGAGFSGLTMAATLQQHRIPFTILEREESLGGNWTYGVYEKVHMISSRRTTEISDFPMPKDYPDFPSARQVLNYLQSYANHFELNDHIQFNSEVLKVQPILDGSQWEVSIKNKGTRKYKGVIVCNGHDTDYVIPTYPGNPTLERIHSRKYKSPEQLRGKRVLVVGGGNSGTDIACDAALVGKYCGYSLRRGYWFLPRMIGGKPTAEIFVHWAPQWAQHLFFATAIRIMHGKYESYGLERPDYTIFDHPISVADDLFLEIRKGKIKVFKDIKSIDDKTVTFIDGKQEVFDMVVFATGYIGSMPMLDHLLTYKDRVPQLVHGVVHPKLKNLYVLGYGQARSGCGPLLHAAASTIRRCIDIQDKMTYPIGIVLRKTGSNVAKHGKCTKEILIETHKSFAKAFWGAYLLRFLPFWERRLFNTKKYDPHKIAASYIKQ